MAPVRLLRLHDLRIHVQVGAEDHQARPFGRSEIFAQDADLALSGFILGHSAHSAPRYLPLPLDLLGLAQDGFVFVLDARS